MAKSNFYRLRLKLGLDKKAAAELCGVTVRTIRNWDRRGSPPYGMTILSMWDRRAVLEEGWEGWVFSRGALMRGRTRLKPDALPHFAAWLEEKQKRAVF